MVKYTAIYMPPNPEGSPIHREPSVVKFVRGKDESLNDAFEREKLDPGRISFLSLGWAQEAGKKEEDSGIESALLKRIEKLEFLVGILRDHARIGDLTFALKEWSKKSGMPEDVVMKAKRWFTNEFLN